MPGRREAGRENVPPPNFQGQGHGDRGGQGRGGRGYQGRGGRGGQGRGGREGQVYGGTEGQCDGGPARGGYSGPVRGGHPPPNNRGRGAYNDPNWNRPPPPNSRGRGAYNDPNWNRPPPPNNRGRGAYNDPNWNRGPPPPMAPPGSNFPGPYQGSGLLGACPPNIHPGPGPNRPRGIPPLIPPDEGPMYGNRQQQVPMNRYNTGNTNHPGMGRCPNPDGYDPPGNLQRSTSTQSVNQDYRGGRRNNPPRSRGGHHDNNPPNLSHGYSSQSLDMDGNYRQSSNRQQPNIPPNAHNRPPNANRGRNRENCQHRDGNDSSNLPRSSSNQSLPPYHGRSRDNFPNRNTCNPEKESSENISNRDANRRGRNQRRGRGRGGRHHDRRNSSGQQSNQGDLAANSDEDAGDSSDAESVITETSEDNAANTGRRGQGRAGLRGRGRWRGNESRRGGRGRSFRNNDTAPGNGSQRPSDSGTIQGSNASPRNQRERRGGRSRPRGRSGYPVFDSKRKVEKPVTKEESDSDDEENNMLVRSSSWDSVASTVSNAQSVSDKQKDKISTDDIQTLSIKTLQNRRNRYKMKLAALRKNTNPDIEGITDYERAINEINKIVNKRTDEERKQTQDKLKSLKETQENADSPEDDPFENDFSSESSEPSTETLPTQVVRKRKNVSSKVGNISFQPKSAKAKSKAVAPSKKTMEKSTSQESAADSATEVINTRDSKQRKSTSTARKNTEENSDILDLLKDIDDICSPKPEVKKPATKELPKVNVSKQNVPRENQSHRTRTASHESEPDASEVFKFIVKQLQGKGSPAEIQQKSGLFAENFDASCWFKKCKQRFSLIERNGTILSVMVHDRECSYCLDYITRRSCSTPNCSRYHICKDLLAGYCKFGEKCRHSHDFFDEKNMPVSKKLGYNNVFNNDEICSILQVQRPHICRAWNENGTCEETSCTKLHLCQRYLFGRCLQEGSECPFVHDRCSEHNKPIVDGFRMSHLQENIFRKMVYSIRSVPEAVPKERVQRKERTVDVHEEEPEGVREEEPVGVREEKPLDVGYGTSIDAVPEQIGAVGGPSVIRNVREREEQPSIHTTDAGGKKHICEAALQAKCRKRKCEDLHLTGDESLPYLWQVKMFGAWRTIDLQEHVEQQYCNNTVDVSSWLNMDNMSLCIQFGQELKALTDDYQELDVRRLSTRSYTVGNHGDQGFRTQWRWYWLDDKKALNLFEPDAFQHTLERKFLAGQENFCYSRDNYRFKYELDFRRMEQRNLDTWKDRKIKRRPLLVLARNVAAKHFPQNLQPPPSVDVKVPRGWMPWDLAHPFELVIMPPTSKEYNEVVANFYKSLDKEDCHVTQVYRLQNSALWQQFCGYEKNMITTSERNNRGSTVDKRKLYHGTSDLKTVYGICQNTFDYRVSGKNGTVYGAGAYFAGDAKYSDSYTKGTERYMFQASVLVGQYTKGHSSYRTPPAKPNTTHELYDSCVDDEARPRIFVVFHHDQYYPEFLIQYTKLSAFDHEPPSRPSRIHTQPSSSTNRGATRLSYPTSTSTNTYPGTGISSSMTQGATPHTVTQGATPHTVTHGATPHIVAQGVTPRGVPHQEAHQYSPPSSMYSGGQGSLGSPQSPSSPTISYPTSHQSSPSVSTSPQRLSYPVRSTPKEEKKCCIQ